MKKLILILLIFVTTLTSCSSIKYSTYDMKEETSGKVTTLNTKNINFAKANEWLATNFVSAKSIIQYADKVEGVIVGRYLMYDKRNIDGITFSDEIYANIIIHTSDNIACITIKIQTPLVVPFESTTKNSGPTPSEVKESINSLIESFKIEMNKNRTCTN